MLNNKHSQIGDIMVAGQLHCFDYGVFKANSVDLVKAINNLILKKYSDQIFIIPMEGGQVNLLKVERD